LSAAAASVAIWVPSLLAKSGAYGGEPCRLRAGRHLFPDLDHPDGVVGPPAQCVDDRAPGGELRVTRDELLAWLGEQALQVSRPPEW
jgi:hypothetical protein